MRTNTSGEFIYESVFQIVSLLHETHIDMLSEFDTDELTEEGRQFYLLACDAISQAEVFARIASMKRRFDNEG